MSSQKSKAYRRLALILAKAFDDGSDAAVERVLNSLPEPGNDWAQHPPPEFPMPWAHRWGQDVYGLWCAFRVAEAEQVMRWIPPGEFWMGSPEDEAERYDREFRHPVTLTRGFWLANTACTQGLWQAVMRENPSRFKGADLPVEQVSWQEVQRFCDRLNQVLLGFMGRLPTEAEWEYACRAGTSSPFWWGNGLTTELANYNGRHPYANGPKGKFRNTTVTVKHFEANPWGLYQMHGNVYEWCQDWYGEYEKNQDAVDPAGPERGAYRVVRGGGWNGRGGWLRAANRYSSAPRERSSLLGFRLAAGPRPGGAW